MTFCSKIRPFDYKKKYVRGSVTINYFCFPQKSYAIQLIGLKFCTKLRFKVKTYILYMIENGFKVLVIRWWKRWVIYTRSLEILTDAGQSFCRGRLGDLFQSYADSRWCISIGQKTARMKREVFQSFDDRRLRSEAQLNYYRADTLLRARARELFAIASIVERCIRHADDLAKLARLNFRALKTTYFFWCLRPNINRKGYPR